MQILPHNTKWHACVIKYLLPGDTGETSQHHCAIKCVSWMPTAFFSCYGLSLGFRPWLPHCRGFETIEFSRGENVAQNLSSMGEATCSYTVAGIAFEYVSSVCILIIWNSHREFHFYLSRHAGIISYFSLICRVSPYCNEQTTYMKQKSVVMKKKMAHQSAQHRKISEPARSPPTKLTRHVSG